MQEKRSEQRWSEALTNVSKASSSSSSSSSILSLHHPNQTLVFTLYTSTMLLGFLSLLILNLSLAYEDPRAYHCPETTHYASNSTFSSNLYLALRTLTNTTPATGFATVTAGDSYPTVTALALCRATIPTSDCQLCVDAAALGIRRVCPNETAAQVWYTLCMIRYSGDDFLNKTDYTIAFRLFDTREAPDPDAYNLKVRMLLRNLSATAGGLEKRYAVGRTTAPQDLTLYGYVDCTRDINGDSCNGCLLAATSEISCCLGQWAVWIATPTCNIQINMDPVHEDWVNGPYVNTDINPAPALGSPPPVVFARVGSDDSIVKIAVISAVGTLVLVAVLLGVAVKWRRREKVERGGCGIKGEEEEMMRKEIGSTSFMYDLEVLVAATDNFSLANRLGAGGFGTVYKGKLVNSEEIAVKKLAPGSTQGRQEFSNEVRLLLKLQHRNLVRLFGCCVEGENRMLVYEYLQNKSLDYFLFDKRKSALLDWPKRYNIIMGVARGLVYLHHDSQHRIIHRDIKASNILLDDGMNPKISDFGLARLFKDEQTHHRTRRIAGTFGYMAPEYAIRGFMSAKIDVFSFGVLILEIISGRKNYDLQLEEENRELLKLAWRLDQEGRLMELVDATVGSFSQDYVLKCLQIGLLCCQKSIQVRPTMSSVMIMLSNDSITIPAAGSHGYQDTRVPFEPQNSNSASGCSENESFSHNSITFSLPNGR